jgi:hypothetical protein
MRLVLALALLAVSTARAQDFSLVSFAVAGAADYAALAKGYDPALVSRLSRFGDRAAAEPLPPLADRPILGALALDDGPAFMKLANSLPSAACHPKASRGKRAPRNLGLAAADSSARIGAACYQRF